MAETCGMIERVARAIVASRNLPEGCEINWPLIRADARAAIKALREPTTDMGWAGYDQLDYEVTPHAAEACWRAMIDAILGKGKS